MKKIIVVFDFFKIVSLFWIVLFLFFILNKNDLLNVFMGQTGPFYTSSISIVQNNLFYVSSVLLFFIGLHFFLFIINIFFIVISFPTLEVKKLNKIDTLFTLSFLLLIITIQINPFGILLWFL